MKKITRIISVLLAVVLIAGIVTVAPFSVSAAESGSFGSFSWTLDNGTLTIKGTGSMDSSAPYGIWDAPWGTGVKKVVINSGATDIAHQAFMDCAELTSVTIPSTVTKVCDLAFYGCESLNNVNISSVTEIGNQAFQGCLSLSDITFSNNLSVVKLNAFESTAWYSSQSGMIYAGSVAYEYKGEDCPETIVLRDGTKGIASRAFYVKSGLKNLTVPEGVTYIGSEAFYGCSIKKIYLPSTLKTIDSQAFNYCNSLDEVHISDIAAWCGVNYIVNAGSDNAGSPFYARAGLYVGEERVYNLEIPSGVTRINSYAFKQCGIDTVIIPDTVTSIGAQAFYYCRRLEGVLIPSSVTSISDSAFSSCKADMIIYGESGTAAETYADNHDFTFVDLSQRQLYTDDETGVSAETVIPDGWKLDVYDFGPGFDMITVPEGEVIEHNYSIAIIDDDNYCKTLLSGTTIRIPIENPEEKLYSFDFNNEQAVPIPFTVENGMMVVENVLFFRENLFFIVAVPVSDEELEPVGNVTATGSAGDCNWKLYENGLLVVSGNGAVPDYESPDRAPWSGLTIKQVNIESGVTGIGDCAFGLCGSLVRVNMADTVKYLGEDVFTNDLALRYVNLSNNIEYVGSDTFYRVPWYSNQSGEDGIIYIGKCAYKYTGDGSEPAVIRDGTVSIGPGAFEDSSVESVTIPGSVKTIGNAAFGWCESLSSINIPNSVKTIGRGAFERCESLPNITIPYSVTEIGENAFRCCTSLTSIYVSANNKNYSSNGGVLFDKDKTVLLQYPIGKTASSYTIPKTVTEIAKSAFEKCESIETVTAYEGLTTIGVSAFDCCYSLASFNIPSTVTTIDEDAFSECESLTGVVLPDGLTTLGPGAFGACMSLTEIEIPDGITEINDAAFWYCWSLTSVKLPSKLRRIGSQAFQGCSFTYISIPSTVTIIEDRAFKECGSLKNIFTSCCPKEVGYDAFDGTPWLTNSNTGIINLGLLAYTCYRNYSANCIVTLWPATMRVNDRAFENQKRVVGINLSESLRNIGSYAFIGTGLSALTIPYTVTNIGDYAVGYKYNNAGKPEKVSGFTIYGYTGSEAEKYAQRNGINFVSLGDAPVIVVTGDVNADGVIDVRDVTAIQRHLNETEMLTEEQIPYADVDGDGAVTIADATLLQMYLAEYDVTFE